MRLLSSLNELEAHEFDAEVAQARFVQCGFSQQQLELIAASPLLARHLLHLILLASSNRQLIFPPDINAKRSRYCELLLAICQRFPGVTQSVPHQHLGEYVMRDEFTSLAALEAIVFAAEHNGSDDTMVCGQLDELICWC